MLKLYQTLTILASPLIRLYLFKRRIKGKEDRLRYKERFGYTKVSRPKGKLAWIHAASVGESISILPLIESFSEKFPGFTFLITTGTVTSARIMESRLPKNAIHQYVPVDILSYVKRFLKHWHPDIAIFVESEIWPNLITQTSKICPLIMVNGHISTESFQNWQKNKSFAAQILGAYSLCLTQNELDTKYLIELGARNVKCLGNIKYDAPPLSADIDKLNKIKTIIGSRPVWVAASTHKESESEESMIAMVHKGLKIKYPDLLTIIIPRHPARKDEILQEISDMKLSIAVRSNNDRIDNITDIYLADTMGELGIFYRIANIVFVGGSLVPRGGHNPLEPARLGCAIIVGPHTFNFTDINNEFIENNAIITVADTTTLKIELDRLLSDSTKTSKLINAALKVVNEKNGIIEIAIREISTYIDNKNAA